MPKVKNPYDRLLDAGLKIFADRGYAGASVQEIAMAAQVTKPTLYYHFGSKEGLFQALVDQAMDERLSEMRQAADRAETTHGKMRNILAAVIELTRRRPRQLRLCFAIAFAAPGEIPVQLKKAEKAQEAFLFVRELIIEGRRRGDLSEIFSIDELARSFFHLCHHASVITLLGRPLLNHHLAPAFCPLEVDAGRLVDLFLQGAGGGAEPAKVTRARARPSVRVAALLGALLFVGGGLNAVAQDAGSRAKDASVVAPPTTNAANTVPPGVPVVPPAAADTVNALPPAQNPLTTPARPVVADTSPIPGVSDLRPVPAAVRASHPELATVSPIAANTNNPRSLDLETCFELTAVRDDSLKISFEQIQVARAQLSEAIAGLWPTFTATNQQQFLHNSSSIGGFNVGTNGGLVSSGINYQSQSNVTMAFTLFNGGQNYNQVGAASAVVAAQRQTLARTYQTIYQDVAQAFYNVLQYQGDLSIQHDLIQGLQARVDDLRSRVNLGRSRPSELLQAQTDFSNAKYTAEQLLGSQRAAQETLAFYIGRPADGIILKETQNFPSAQALESYVQHSGLRPDVLSEVETLRQAQRNLSVAKGAIFPTITANGDYLASNDPAAATTDATMTIQASMPIFDGGLILGRINENRATVRETRFNVEEMARTADEDTRMAYVNFTSSVGQVIVLREAVILAAKNLEAQVDDYLKGVVSNLDVLTALEDYQNVRTSLHNANMGARLNLINLNVASGVAATGPGANGQALPRHDEFGVIHRVP